MLESPSSGFRSPVWSRCLIGSQGTQSISAVTLAKGWSRRMWATSDFMVTDASQGNLDADRPSSFIEANGDILSTASVLLKISFTNGDEASA